MDEEVRWPAYGNLVRHTFLVTGETLVPWPVNELDQSFANTLHRTLTRAVVLNEIELLLPKLCGEV
jgi:hypothetical protein